MLLLCRCGSFMYILYNYNSETHMSYFLLHNLGINIEIMNINSKMFGLLLHHSSQKDFVGTCDHWHELVKGIG